MAVPQICNHELQFLLLIHRNLIFLFVGFLSNSLRYSGLSFDYAPRLFHNNNYGDLGKHIGPRVVHVQGKYYLFYYIVMGPKTYFLL